MHDLIPLCLLPAGQLAEVHTVSGQTSHVRRLEELGIRDGAQLEIVRHGSPCIIQLEGSKICFRDGELLQVLVSPKACG